MLKKSAATVVFFMFVAFSLIATAQKEATNKPEKPEPAKAKPEKEKRTLESVAAKIPGLPPDDTVIGRVGDTEFTMGFIKKDLNKRLKRFIKGVEVSKQEEFQLKKDYRNFCEKLLRQYWITRELFLKGTKDDGISIPKKDVDEYIENLRKNVPNYEQFLKERGWTPEENWDYHKTALLEEKYLEIKYPYQKLSEEELKKYYEENKKLYAVPELVRASHILFMTMLIFFFENLHFFFLKRLKFFNLVFI